jgi:hypothetical protein
MREREYIVKPPYDKKRSSGREAHVRPAGPKLTLSAISISISSYIDQSSTATSSDICIGVPCIHLGTILISYPRIYYCSPDLLKNNLGYNISCQNKLMFTFLNKIGVLLFTKIETERNTT